MPPQQRSAFPRLAQHRTRDIPARAIILKKSPFLTRYRPPVSLVSRSRRFPGNPKDLRDRKAGLSRNRLPGWKTGESDRAWTIFLKALVVLPALCMITRIRDRSPFLRDTPDKDDCCN